MSPTEVPLVPLLLALNALVATPALAQDPRARPGSTQRPGQEIMHRPGMPAMPPTHDPLEWHPGPSILRGSRPGELELVLDVPPGFVVYRDQLAVEVIDGADLDVGHPDIPPGLVRLVPGRDEVPREQYDTDVVVRIPARAEQLQPGMRTLRVRVRHQGCFGGHCYRPSERVVDVHVPVRPHEEVEPPKPAVDAEGNPIEEPPGTEPDAVDESAGELHRAHPMPHFVVYATRPIGWR